MKLASRALLRGPDSCSRPADGPGNSAASSNAREVCATGLPPCWSESVFQSGMITSCLRRILGHGGNSRG